MSSVSLILIILFFQQSLQAQTYTLNHASSFAPAWADGNTSGTASNIGGSGINCTLTTTASGGVYTGPNGTGTGTPTVGNTIFVVGGSTSNFEVCMNFTTNAQHTDVVYQFSGFVKDVIFNIGDIDKVSAASNSYFDQVVVTGFDGTTTINPTLTKYTPASTFVVITGNTANANTTSGQGGNSNSTLADQNATVIVNFGVTPISRITVRYQNAAGAMADPGAQAVGIGNISFSKVGSLPLTLTSFNSRKENLNAVLNWTTENEVAFRGFHIERSIDGANFTKIGDVESKPGLGRKLYSYNDLNPGSSGSNIFYYRLRMMDKDGTFTMSPIIWVKFRSDLRMSLSVTPNPVSDRIIAHLWSDINSPVELSCYNASGQCIFRKSQSIVKGENLIGLDLDKNLVAGWYVLRLSAGERILTTPFSVVK